MPQLPHLQPETIAFWIGFLAATLFWWIVGRLRPFLPGIKEKIKNIIQAGRRKDFERINDGLRRDALTRAQQQHLAASLCPLEDLLIQPRLLAPPPIFIQPDASIPERITSHVIPFTPDGPELASQYPVPTLTLLEAVQHRPRLVITGRPGCGKSTALASLAIQLAQQSTETGSPIPILLHILDIPFGDADKSSLDALIKAVTPRAPVLLQSRIPAYLKTMSAAEKLLLLVDGLDELNCDALTKASNYLAQLSRDYPTLRIITTGSPDTLNGLLAAGFLPLPLQAWQLKDRTEFLNRWERMWLNLVVPELGKIEGAYIPTDTRLVKSWIATEINFSSPLELTLQLWGAFAGDLPGPVHIDAIETFLRRQTQNRIPYQVLALLAHEFLQRKSASLPYQQLDSYLSKVKVAALGKQEDAQQQEKEEGLATRKTSRKKERKITSGGRILSALLECGILTEHAGEQIRFTNPVFTGFLASWIVTAESLDISPGALQWVVNSITVHYFAARGSAPLLIPEFAPSASDPSLSRPLTAAGWLRDAAPGAEWTSQVLRSMVSRIQDDSLAPGVIGKYIYAFASASEPSIPVLFKQLFASSNPVVRRFAALGAGLLCSPKIIDDLIRLLADPQPDVRYAAVLGLSIIPDLAAEKAVAGVLLHGDEDLQLAAAEILAGNAPDGHEILKDALTIDSLLVRRAAVLGLSCIQERWAQELLEKVAIEDGQWVVRSAAVQGVEQIQKGNPYLPQPVPEANQAPWLIAFAGKQGAGIPPDRYPLEMLSDALKNGTADEKLSAMIYLRDHPGEDTFRVLSELSRSTEGYLRDGSLYSLWYLAAAGASTPAA